MIPFKDITLADKDTITSFTMKSDRRNCDLSFSNLCSWRFLYDTQFAVVDNFLVFKFWAGEQIGRAHRLNSSHNNQSRMPSSA